MHDRWKLHGRDMIGKLSKVLELGDTCVRDCMAWPIGKTMLGAFKDVMSLSLTCGGFLEFQEGNGCRDHGGTSCVCAFGDVTRIRRSSPIPQSQSVRGGREEHPPPFRQAPRPGTLCLHPLDAGHLG